MREPVANLVHAVLHHGLALKDRLEAGESADFATERAVLKGMLLNDLEARQWIEYGGDATESDADDKRFLGVRYALVCWLDELFILDSPWTKPWNEQKLEAELYGTNDRAWKFWDQARRAEARREKDALEVFYLCVMLGFAGQLREQPDKLQAWVTAAKTSLAPVKESQGPFDTDLDPPTRVPPLHGREKLQKMVLTGGVLLLLLVPVVAFFVVRKLGQ